MSRLLILWPLLCPLFAVADEPPLPRLAGFWPPAVQIGEPSSVMAFGVTDLEHPVVLRLDAAAAEVAPADDGPKLPDEPRTFVVTTKLAASPRLVTARLETGYGPTESRSIVLQSSPVLVESEPNDRPGEAARLSEGVPIYGRIERTADVDCYQFEAAPGAISIVCDADRFGSPLMPRLKLRDPAGRLVATAGRAHAGSASLETNVTSAGLYELRLSDFAYAGGDAFVYRLQVNGGPKLSEPAGIVSPLDSSVSWSTLEAVETAQPATLPCYQRVQFDGRSGRHRLLFDLEKGQPIIFSATATSDSAAFDPVLVIERELGGDPPRYEQLELADDTPAVGMLARSLAESTAAQIQFTPPVDGRYRATLLERVGGSLGSPEECLLRVHRPRQNFTLTAMPLRATGGALEPATTAILHRDGVTLLGVRIDRTAGCDAEILLWVSGLPPGVSATRTVVPPSATEAVIPIYHRSTESQSVQPPAEYKISVAGCPVENVYISASGPADRMLTTVIPLAGAVDPGTTAQVGLTMMPEAGAVPLIVLPHQPTLYSGSETFLRVQLPYAVDVPVRVSASESPGVEIQPTEVPPGSREALLPLKVNGEPRSVDLHLFAAVTRTTSAFPATLAHFEESVLSVPLEAPQPERPNIVAAPSGDRLRRMRDVAVPIDREFISAKPLRIKVESAKFRLHVEPGNDGDRAVVAVRVERQEHFREAINVSIYEKTNEMQSIRPVDFQTVGADEDRVVLPLPAVTTSETNDRRFVVRGTTLSRHSAAFEQTVAPKVSR